MFTFKKLTAQKQLDKGIKRGYYPIISIGQVPLIIISCLMGGVALVALAKPELVAFFFK